MKLSFKHLNLKAKVIFIGALILVLAGAGVLTILAKTGKIKIGADTINDINITLSGQVLDSHFNPIPEATLVVVDSTNHLKELPIRTNNGSYSVNFSLPKSNSSFTYIVKKDGYDLNNAKVLSLPAKSTNISDSMDAVLFEAPVLNNGNNCPNGWDSTITVSGIIFCYHGKLLQENMSKSTDLLYPSVNAWAGALAKEIIRLQGLTGVGPKMVFLDENVLYNAAYHRNDTITFQLGSDRKIDSISDNVDFFNHTIDHEFGHLVDFKKGDPLPSDPDDPTIAQLASTYCYDKCPISARSGFLEAWSILNDDNIFTGRSMTDQREMFAQIFSFLVSTKLNDKYTYITTNYLFSDNPVLLYKSIPEKYCVPTGGTLLNPLLDEIINISSQPKLQNALLLIYKEVVKAANLVDPYPGQISGILLKTQFTLIGDDLSAANSAVTNGLFMTKGVISAKVINYPSQPLPEVNISVNDQNGTTRKKQIDKVFSDGTGDLYDLAGTVVLMNVPNGSQPIALKYNEVNIKPLYYTPKTVNAIQGANSLLNIKMNMRTKTWDATADFSPSNGWLQSTQENAKVIEPGTIVPNNNDPSAAILYFSPGGDMTKNYQWVADKYAFDGESIGYFPAIGRLSCDMANGNEANGSSTWVSNIKDVPPSNGLCVRFKFTDSNSSLDNYSLTWLNPVQ